MEKQDHKHRIPLTPPVTPFQADLIDAETEKFTIPLG
jgi:hypothetical protein